MPSPTWKLDRRTFLRGTGVTLALPLLEATCPRTTAAEPSPRQSPRRLVCIGSSYGVHAPAFFPAKTGNDFALTELLTPLKNSRRHWSVVEGLDHGVGGGHKGVQAFLTGVRFSFQRGGMYSLDQYAADRIGSETRFASLSLDVGGGSSWSWNRYGVKLRGIGNPQALFDHLFRQTSTDEKSRQRRELDTRGSILDAVLASARQIDRTLGHNDRHRFREYLNAINETERRLKRAGHWLNQPKPQQEFPGTNKSNNGQDKRLAIMKLMFDLMTLALQTDSTRIASLHIPGGNGRFQIDGVGDGYHSLSHHGQDPAKIKQLKLIEIEYTRALARFLDQLAAVSEGDGTLLDNTIVYFGSGMGNASSHSNRNLPVLVAGGGFQHGRSLKFPPGKIPLCNLYVSMLQQLGIETDSFSTATGTLTGFA
ncbi:MAG: DUF1552 domain-containing protein [Planctomycetaceae bacterium]|jgi:hypothetical protein|nr:DUF1552 domain-containing protein [Planctomycetaceae bacterium]